MSGFLRRAASRVLGRPSEAPTPHPFSGLFLASASPPAAGHLGDLPQTGRENRALHDVVAPADLAKAEALGNATAAKTQRLYMALLDVEDGRFDDALAWLARESLASRLCLAAFCDLLGRTDLCDHCLACFPEHHHPLLHQQSLYQIGIVSATLGGIQLVKFAGSEGRVAAAGFQIIDESVTKGKMSAFQIFVAAMLKRAAKRTIRDPAALDSDHGTGMFGAFIKALSGGPNTEGPPFFVLKAWQALLSAVVLRAPPLSGERVRAMLQSAERDLAHAVREREDPAFVANLRLLAAFLAARDGRFDDALERYVEMERVDPSDPRPHYLAHLVCRFDERPEESDKWLASYDRLVTGSSVDEQAALISLADDLVIALAIGGSHLAFDCECYPVEVDMVVSAAASKVDATLVSALWDKKMPMVERLEIRAVRALLHAGVWSLLKRLENNGAGSTTD
ncbi:hypothetical protein HU200_050438 [Digitaria exilis]|uniref:Uncharacterized protein n=1 Tax=Digitaria exilis TaxID=1010633 RepID=A0A835AXK0_9POAL|nr:hypothetical protein HU200_050438 [Digitaria exilis]CAB3473218.1 unnamed protein product [Digitaria exilis]